MSSGIIDSHTHPFSCPLNLFLEEMERAKLRCCVPLFSIRNPSDIDRPDVRKRISSRLQGDLSRMQERIFEGIRGYIGSLANPTNKDVADLAKRYPDKFVPFGSVYMNGSEEQLEEQLKEGERLGLRGLKLLPTLQLFNPSESRNFEKVCEWCEKKRWVIMYHTGCDPGPFEIPEVAEDANPRYLVSVLERYSPRIVLAHFGAYSAYHMGLWFDEAITVAKKFDYVYADTSAAVSFILMERNLKRIRAEVGLDRLLFGTDFPVVGGSDIVSGVNAVSSCRYLSEGEKAVVLGENAARLLSL
ncbi:MAG: amidohydrolase family protein [Thaumarchaeota archaeon]|nr:amidohydrolase family protein [Nitrososphaerota archaeon]